MSSNSAKASSKKKSQKSEKSEVEDASEIRLREIAHEMESGTQLKEQTPLWYRVIMFSLLALASCGLLFSTLRRAYSRFLTWVCGTSASAWAP